MSITDEELVRLAEGLGWTVEPENSGLWFYGPDAAGHELQMPLDWLRRWEGAGAVVEAWRATRQFCCITIKSDFDFGYDISWVRFDDDSHQEQALPFQTCSGPEAIARAALSALGGTHHA